MREDDKNIHRKRKNHQHGPYQCDRGSHHHHYDDDIQRYRPHWQVCRWDGWHQLMRYNCHVGKCLNRQHGPYQRDRGSYHHHYDDDIEHSRPHWQVSRWDRWHQLTG